jgi:predicted AAA+ superfamily ATPase
MTREFPCVVVTGARQVGKTTLLKNLFPKHAFISLDLPSVAEQADNDPSIFLSQFEGPVIIDEVQYAPRLFRHLKVKIDEMLVKYCNLLTLAD